MTRFHDMLAVSPHIIVRQRKELAEVFGFETRNKYEVATPDGQVIGFAAEQQKGVLGFVMRQILGHWRSFDIHMFDAGRQPVGHANHPFRWIFQRLDIFDDKGKKLGGLQQRFALLHKKFDVEGRDGRLKMTVYSSFWRIWTFPFMAHGKEVARVEKKWSCLLKETFLDADNFHISYTDPKLSRDDRLLLMAAAFFIDLQYFERKSGR